MRSTPLHFLHYLTSNVEQKYHYSRSSFDSDVLIGVETDSSNNTSADPQTRADTAHLSSDGALRSRLYEQITGVWPGMSSRGQSRYTVEFDSVRSSLIDPYAYYAYELGRLPMTRTP